MSGSLPPEECPAVEFDRYAVELDGPPDDLGRHRHQSLLVGKTKQKQVACNTVTEQRGSQLGGIDEVRLALAHRLHQRFTHGHVRHLCIRIVGEVGGRSLMAKESGTSANGINTSGPQVAYHRNVPVQVRLPAVSPAYPLTPASGPLRPEQGRNRTQSNMTNPYQSPASAVELPATHGSGSTAVIQLIAGLMCALLAALIPTLVIPQFRQVFTSFGTDLPLTTRIALNYHLWLWLLPLVVIAVRLFWPRARKRPRAACLAGIAGLVIALAATLLAMYLPIYQMGSAL